MPEHRVGLARSGDEPAYGDRAILTIGEERRLNPALLLARSHFHQLDKASHADGQLASMGIGDRQVAGLVAVKTERAVTDKLRLPRLAIVRIGGQQGIGERPQAYVGILPCQVPGRECAVGPARGQEGTRRGADGNDTASRQHGEHAPAGGILGLSGHGIATFILLDRST